MDGRDGTLSAVRLVPWVLSDKSHRRPRFLVLILQLHLAYIPILNKYYIRWYAGILQDVPFDYVPSVSRHIGH